MEDLPRGIELLILGSDPNNARPAQEHYRLVLTVSQGQSLSGSTHVLQYTA